MNEKNFKWLMNDIDNTLVLKVVYMKNGIQEEYCVLNVIEVLETFCDKLDIAVGNINDLTNLLTLGVVRFANIVDSSDVIEIPFNKMYLLYHNGWRLPNVEIPFSDIDNKVNKFEITDYKEGKLISFNDLGIFSVIDGIVRNDLFLFPVVIDNVSNDLISVMEIAYKYNQYDMQEKFDALKKVDEINRRRLIRDFKNMHLR